MPDNNRQPKDNTSQPEPKIRTMKSDIAEYLKEKKPSLLEIMTKQVEIRPAPLEPKPEQLPVRRIIVFTAALALVSAVVWLGYSYVPNALRRGESVTTEERIAPSVISVEKTRTLDTDGSFPRLRQDIINSALTPERQGSFKRIILLTKQDETTRPLTASDFFRILGVAPPTKVSDSLTGDLFLYIYYSNSGPRAAIISRSRDPGRSFAGMLSWESGIQRDLETIFLEERVGQVAAPFLDKTFKNISYRFLELRPDLGIGHFMFSAKNYLVITTSEEALTATINRLLESR